MYDENGTLLGEYGAGGSQSSGTSQYIYLPTASGPMPIAAVIKGQTYAVHSDHLNTPRKLTQADGQVAWQWAYSAFGDEQPTLGAKRFTSETTNPTTGATSIPEVAFNLRYPGQTFDKETKLHYNYHRSYDSRTGRYTQGDPIGLDGGGGIGLGMWMLTRSYISIQTDCVEPITATTPLTALGQDFLILSCRNRFMSRAILGRMLPAISMKRGSSYVFGGDAKAIQSAIHRHTIPEGNFAVLAISCLLRQIPQTHLKVAFVMHPGLS